MSAGPAEPTVEADGDWDDGENDYYDFDLKEVGIGWLPFLIGTALILFLGYGGILAYDRFWPGPRSDRALLEFYLPFSKTEPDKNSEWKVGKFWADGDGYIRYKP